MLVVSSIVTEQSGEGARGEGNIMGSVWDRLSFRKWCDIQINRSVSRLVMCEKTDGVS